MPHARIKAKQRNGNNSPPFQFKPLGSLSTLNKFLEDFNHSIEENICKNDTVIFFNNSTEDVL